MRRALLGAALFSGTMNLLALAGPLFMLEVYDRVIPSQSVHTLVALVLLIAGLFAFSGFLDVIRARVMSRIAGTVDAQITSKVIAVIAGAPLRTRLSDDVLKPAHEADHIRSFLSSPGPLALFDLPWMPLYLAICFFLHPLIGWLATGTMLLLVGLTILSDIQTRSRIRQISQSLTMRNKIGEAAHINAEAIAAMGLLPRVVAHWTDFHEQAAALQRETGDLSGLFSSLTKSIRQFAQSGALALGAWLVIQGDMTAGSIIAGSIIVARALQPIEQLIGNWRNLIKARDAWQRLRNLFELFPEDSTHTALPKPSKELSVEGVFASPPGLRSIMTVQNVNFRVNAGTIVGIIGPSASGKSSLVRTITGVWPQVRGRVRLDGASLDQWSHQDRGHHIGYMPQSSELFPGTIAQNIARLNSNAPATEIIRAAKAAGVHDMIVDLPNGYETKLDDGAVNLSAGQRQRVALACALYGDPFLVVLDEPNSNLDLEGDKALAAAINGVRERGGIVIIVAHRNSIMSQIDNLLVLENGLAKAYGPREAVLKSLQQRNAQFARSPRVVPAPTLAVVENEEVEQ